MIYSLGGGQGHNLGGARASEVRWHESEVPLTPPTWRVLNVTGMRHGMVGIVRRVCRRRLCYYAGDEQLVLSGSICSLVLFAGLASSDDCDMHCIVVCSLMLHQRHTASRISVASSTSPSSYLQMETFPLELPPATTFSDG
jgi:hypothetical protein